MEPLIGLLAVFSVLFLPIAGVMVILTTRLAFKPLVEKLTEALRESGYTPPASPALRIQELSEQVEALAEQVRELKEARDFDRKLMAGR